MKRILATLGVIFAVLNTSLLHAGEVRNLIRGNAKFNAVIIVLAIIFGGIVFFLFRMDRRLSKLEKQKENPS